MIIYRTGNPWGNDLSYKRRKAFVRPAKDHQYLFAAPSIQQAGFWAENMKFEEDCQVSTLIVSAAYRWIVPMPRSFINLGRNTDIYDLRFANEMAKGPFSSVWDGQLNSLHDSREASFVELLEVIYNPLEVSKVRVLTKDERKIYWKARNQFKQLECEDFRQWRKEMLLKV